MPSTNELRVFISSTFRDLQEEREHLVKKIFPEIRALCRERGITFTEVDLRWGVTEENIVLGQVVRTCLEEIDRCRPYFIGLTGERYGWSPELHEFYKDPQLFTNWPWLEDAAMDGASITDIEFRHGALNNSQAPGTACFFFRDLQASPPEGEIDTQLEELKNRVRSSGQSVNEYSDPEALGRLVYTELVAIINRDFADAKPPSPLEDERSRHEAFAASRRRAYIPNPDYLKRLSGWLADDDKPLILYAESGSGKSSLLSFWTEQLCRRRPDLHIIEHYVGIGAGDNDHLGIIRHVMEEIKERYERVEEIPAKPEELEKAFANWLGFGVGAPILLVIDGINQLSGHALELGWLPSLLPEGVKLIISSTVEQTLVRLRERGWKEIGMQPLTESEREAVVVRFLAEYSKALSTDQVKRIATDPKSAHPLFLRTLLEELRVHGLHEGLEGTLDNLLDTTGTEDLFQKVLGRLEDDHGSDNVRKVLSLLWASRTGAKEEELEAITGVSRLKLSTMLLSLDYHLLRRDGLLTFFHDYLRRAVEKRYLSDERSKREQYRHVADYFESGEKDVRSTLELLGALEYLDEGERIAEVLGQIDRLRLLWQADPHEVLRLWSTSEIGELVSVCSAGLDHWLGQDRSVNEQVGTFGALAMLYKRVGAWHQAQELERRRLTLLRSVGARADEVFVLSRLCNIAHQLGKTDEAREFGDLAEQNAREIGDRRGILSAVASLGILYYGRGEYDTALSYYHEQEKVAREIGDRQTASHAIGNRGVIHFHRYDYDKALVCYREQEKIAKEMGDRRGLSHAIGNRGLVEFNYGRFDDALVSMREWEEIAVQLGDRQGIFNAATNRGALYFQQGNYHKALQYLQKGIDGHREIGFLYGLTFPLGEIGKVLLQITEDKGLNVNEQAMPSYLAQYVSDLRKETWQADTLREARKNVEESVATSEEISRPDTLFSGRILVARITAAEGDSEGGITILEELLGEQTMEPQQAELHYWLWKLGASGEDHRSASLQLFQALIQKKPRLEYRLRIEELSEGVD